MFGFRPLSPSRPNRPCLNLARPHLEQFECRTLPSGFGSVVPLQAAGPVVADVQHIRSDLQSLTRLAGSQASSQLTAVRNDVGKLVGDVLSGKSAAVSADLETLSTDEAALLKSLGTTSPARAATLLTDLRQDILSLNNDVAGLGKVARGRDLDDGRDDDRGDDIDGRVDDIDDIDDGEGQDEGPTRTVIRDLLNIRQDLQALTTSLGSGITPTVTGDIAAVRTALGSVIGDLIGGTSPTQDLTTLQTALTTLTTDIGTGTPAQGALTALTTDIQKLTTDVGALTNPALAALARVQSDVTSLESALGSNLSSAAQADVAALDAAIKALAADIAAGTPITNDLGNALTSEFNLLGDLTSPLPEGARQSLVQLAADLIRLSPVLNG